MRRDPLQAGTGVWHTPDGPAVSLCGWIGRGPRGAWEAGGLLRAAGLHNQLQPGVRKLCL